MTALQPVTMCHHDRCQENTHCILDALWLNPPEFENGDPIRAAAILQESFWKIQREYKERENSVVNTLWMLVDEGNGTHPGTSVPADSDDQQDVGSKPEVDQL